MKERLSFLSPLLPYGVLHPWDDLNPQLYLAVHIYWLKFYGLWYNMFPVYSAMFWAHILYGLIVLWLVCFLPGIGEVVYLLRRRDNIGEIAEGLYLFLSEMYTYIKLSAFWLNKDKILNLLEYLHCEEFKPREVEHREILRRSIKTARFVMTYYSTMCVGAVTVGIIMPIAEHFQVLPTNVEYPYFDVYKSPSYEITYVHHIYYKPATCIIDGVMDTILAAFIASALGQIEVLSFNLRNFNMIAERRESNLKRKPSRYHVRTVLKDVVKHHNSIIRYVSLVEDAFSLASALQLMLSAMVLCLVGIQFLSIRLKLTTPVLLIENTHPLQSYQQYHAAHKTGKYYTSTRVSPLSEASSGVVDRSAPWSSAERSTTPEDASERGETRVEIEEPSSHPIQIAWMAIYLTCMLIEVFIICWYGDELIWKSSELCQAAYESSWLTTDPKTAMFLIIFMERCKRPLRVTAGKMFTLSLDTYTNLINWAYKAFAVMRKMKK